MSDLADIARQLITANVYLALGTADPAGNPWVSPVFYTPAGYGDFYWVSSPETQHSQNIATRPEVSLVIFDSTSVIGEGQGVYVSGTAEQLRGDELERGIDVFSRRSVAQGARAWMLEAVTGPAPLRLYRATVEEAFLGIQDERTAVSRPR